MVSVMVSAPGLVRLVRVGKITHERDIYILKEVNGREGGRQDAWVS